MLILKQNDYGHLEIIKEGEEESRSITISRFIKEMSPRVVLYVLEEDLMISPKYGKISFSSIHNIPFELFTKDLYYENEKIKFHKIYKKEDLNKLDHKKLYCVISELRYKDVYCSRDTKITDLLIY